MAVSAQKDFMELVKSRGYERKGVEVYERLHGTERGAELFDLASQLMRPLEEQDAPSTGKE